MKNSNINYKIEQLKKEVINNNFSYSYLIINMLTKHKLNKLINKITDTKTKVDVTTITKKKYLNKNEQFLYLLNNFIYIFKEDFYFLQINSDYIIETLLQDEKHTKYLLCKKYIGNNKHLQYFSHNIKKLTTYGFYNNLKLLSRKSDTIKKFIKDNKINLRKGIICNKETEKIYNILLQLSICNAKFLNNYQLFEDIKFYISQILINNKNNSEQLQIIIEQNYINNWEIMIKNYYEKKDAINILLN